MHDQETTLILFQGVIVPGEERWNLLQPWDEIKVEKKIRDYFSSSKNNNTDDLTPSTSLLTEMLHLDPNENFENLYGIYDKIWEKEPINSLFLRQKYLYLSGNGNLIILPAEV